MEKEIKIKIKTEKRKSKQIDIVSKAIKNYTLFLH